METGILGYTDIWKQEYRDKQTYGNWDIGIEGYRNIWKLGYSDRGIHGHVETGIHGNITRTLIITDTHMYVHTCATLWHPPPHTHTHASTLIYLYATNLTGRQTDSQTDKRTGIREIRLNEKKMHEKKRNLQLTSETSLTLHLRN